jgi:hypothetical protein
MKEIRMIRAVVKPAPDGKYVATVEDKGGNVLWGPSEPDEHDKALKAAQRERDRILRVASNRLSRVKK